LAAAGQAAGGADHRLGLAGVLVQPDKLLQRKSWRSGRAGRLWRQASFRRTCLGHASCGAISVFRNAFRIIISFANCRQSNGTFVTIFQGLFFNRFFLPPSHLEADFGMAEDAFGDEFFQDPAALALSISDSANAHFRYGAQGNPFRVFPQSGPVECVGCTRTVSR